MTDAATIDDRTRDAIRRAIVAAQAGELTDACRIGEDALARGGETAALNAMLGMLRSRAGDLPGATANLRLAHRARPADATIACNLISALIDQDSNDEALAVASRDFAFTDPSLRVARYRGFLAQSLDRCDEAVEAYEHVVARLTDDFESWNNLGNARDGVGDIDGSIIALQTAARLNPLAAPTRINLARALAEAGRLDEAVDNLRLAAADFPADPTPLTDLSTVLRRQGRDADVLAALNDALARDPRDIDLLLAVGKESGAQLAFTDAERAFDAALAIDTANAEALVGLAMMFERVNREDELPGLIGTSVERHVDPGAIDFIRALDHRRAGRQKEGLTALRRSPPEIAPVRHANLEGQFLDRLGDPAGAFAAFTEMNRQLAEDGSDAPQRAQIFRDNLARDRAITTRDWYASWSHSRICDDRPSPAFLVGFPRSGTTLLDTMLMGHPDVEVMEEQPALHAVHSQFPTIEALASFDDAQLAAARADYFREAAQFAPLRPGTLLVDKHPLQMNNVPLIHRLFPDAKFILAMRHPCDVLLSCFMTSFRQNNAMVNFLDLDNGAALYDLSFSTWSRSLDVLPVAHHMVRYEAMVEDGEAELRPLIDFLGLEWRGELLDHQRTARARGLITTASFAQVVQPIYRHSAGRWERYRDQLAPIFPIVRPWVEQYGYTLDEGATPGWRAAS